jgi:carboxypeptidase Taq
MTAWNDLKTRMDELDALGGAIAVLEWDQQTCMPTGGARARGAQSALLGKLSHERFTAPEVGGWLEALAADATLDDLQRRAVAVLHRRYRRANAIPAALVEDLSHARTNGFAAWVKAKEADDFAIFEAPLQRLIDLTREQARLYGTDGHPYDALLEDYDPGSTVAQLRPMFERLGSELRALLDAVSDRPHPAGFSGKLDVDGQKRLSERVMADLGFDRERGRLDISAHPFTIGIDPEDVRITTHYHEDNFLAALGGTIHETGHGLYEQGIPTAWAGTGLNRAAGMGLHESQSRFWENYIGRSLAFCRYLAPRMAGIWPSSQVSAEALYAAMNRVERSLVRIFADEVTYNLHIIARFEVELGIIEGRLNAADLPGAWDAAYAKYVGVTAPSAKEGVLQDVHWSSGLFGYFPSYTIGNLYAASLGAKISEDLPDLWAQVEAGRFADVLAWLREKIHGRGHMEDAPEIIRAAVGDRDPVTDLVTHLWERQGRLYGAARA